jgi:hypothetical protein
LTDKPPLEPEEEWFTNESSFVLSGEKKAGYAVVSHEEVIEAWPLPAGISTQKVELISLTRALILGKGKRQHLYSKVENPPKNIERKLSNYQRLFFY